MKIKVIIFFLFFFLLVDTSFSKDDNKKEELPELTWELHFYANGIWEIHISMWEIWWTPVAFWEYWEWLFNTFINKSIEVSLYCTSTACEPNTHDSIIMNENWVWSLSIEDKHWRTLTKKFHVRKINKTKPVWELSYSIANSVWINSSKTVTLDWTASIFGVERFNRDWLVWNSSPSYLCDVEGWCSWFLFLTDSAGNILKQAYTIKNIDKTQPIIHVNKYAVISDWKQKVWISCTDNWWSWCVTNSEVIKWLQLSTTSNQCVKDNAWNSRCANVTTDQSSRDYSDSHLNWTNSNRKIYLDCLDEPGGSWCVKSRESKIIINNIIDTSLTIKDFAWNSLTKHFQISKIDKELPTISISWFSTFKATDQNKIKISSSDELSWLNKITYKWNNTCKNWTSISWTLLINNSWINYTVAWNHKLYVCAIDNTWNIKEVNKNFIIYPWDLSDNKTYIEASTNGDKVANNNDYYNYTLNLMDKYGNKIYNKDLDLLEYSVNPSDKILYTSMINTPSWNSALHLKIPSSLSDNNWKINFTIKSLSPWEFTQRFKLSINNWWNTYIDNSSITTIYEVEKSNKTNLFKQPLIWELSVTEWWNTPEIWKDQKYKIKLNLTDNKPLLFSNWKLNISESTIVNKVNWHFWNTFWWVNNNFWNNLNTYLWFSWSIDANDNILTAVKLWLNKLVVSYTLWWQYIEYYLNDFWTNWCSLKTLWLKVLWTLQWDWKSSITWQESNFSDLSKWELRSIIRINAFKLIKWLSSWDIVNWIKYIDWQNIELSWDNLWFETIIVKNWNVIINWDLNISNKKLWIIVLKDNYLIDSDYNKKWNIYVDKNVSKINAIIYADWAFRSAKSNWTSYLDSELNNKLIFNWSLFTRNTIGWAVKANTEYLLPWWKKTNNFDLAEIYDLNYIRKVDNSCNIDEDYSFLIKYNSSIQTNPPIWFSIK